MTRILIIEDNIGILESLMLDLQMRGYEVLSAQNGQEALSLLEDADELSDIIVSDIAMPGMDGYQLLEAIQKSPELQTIPFIYLTAFNSESAIRAGKALGADDYLVKPFKVEDLVIAVENKLKRAQQYREGESRKLDKARRELLRLLSHELRTPLTSIYGGADMLMKNVQGLPDEMSRHLLTMVRTGAKRMNHLISQILTLVQIDSGVLAESIERQSRPVDVNAAIRQTWNTVQKELSIPSHEVNVQFELPEPTLWVEGVQAQLISAFSEVFRNAMLFMSPEHSIVVGVTEEDGQVVITVRDSGPGIPAEMQSQVWQRFVQVDHEGIDRQGSGLGLSLVREILRLHRGSAALESVPGQGTLVTLRLPAASQSPQLNSGEAK